MLRGLLSKELLEAIHGYKLLLSFLLAILVIPFSMYLGVQRYKVELAEYQRSTRESRQAFLDQSPKPPHTAAHFGLAITKPPTPLVALSSGVHDILGTRTRIDPHVTPQLHGSLAERTPLLMLFGKVDFTFVIYTIFSLFALVLSFDLIAGEREDGTLKLVLSNSISRGKVIWAKLVSGVLVLLVPLLFATVGSLLFFTPLFGVSLTADQWLRLAWILVLSGLFLLMMFLLGLLVSSMTRRRITAMIVLLILWVGLVFLVPRSAANLAQQIQPIPSAREVDNRLRTIQKEAMEDYRARIEEFLQDNPQYDRRSLPPEFRTRNRKQMDEHVERREARLREEVDAVKARQIDLASNLARLSPVTAYLLAVTEVSGTGVHRHRRFLRYLNEFRHRFTGFFDELEMAGRERVSDYESAPSFQYSEATVGDVLPRLVFDLGYLLISCLVLYGFAHFAFIRSDIR